MPWIRYRGETERKQIRGGGDWVALEGQGLGRGWKTGEGFMQITR